MLNYFIYLQTYFSFRRYFIILTVNLTVNALNNMDKVQSQNQTILRFLFRVAAIPVGIVTRSLITQDPEFLKNVKNFKL
jgi:hypothetical protein